MTGEKKRDIFAEIREGLEGGGESHGSLELTMTQAAEFLGVSPQFLVGVLERGEISYREAGCDRRVSVKDLLGYRQSMQAKSRAALDELARLSEETGAYDL